MREEEKLLIKHETLLKIDCKLFIKKNWKEKKIKGNEKSTSYLKR